MPPHGKSRIKKDNPNVLSKFYKKYVNYEFVKSLVLDPARLPIVSFGILLAELILNVFVVQKVKYTEIDWIAYMQECEGFVNGTTNYALLRGELSNITSFSGSFRLDDSYRSFNPFQVTPDRWCIQLDSSTSTLCSTT